MIKLECQKLDKPLRFAQGAIILAIITLFFSACSSSTSTKTLPNATGQSNELLVVIDTANWNGILGKSLRRTFSQAQLGLPQEEPYFELVQIPHRAFTNIFKTTSNICVVKIENNTSAKLAKQKDRWAKGQLYMEVIAANEKEASELVTKNADGLLQLFRSHEIEKMKKLAKNVGNKKYKATLAKEYGVQLSIPADFKEIPIGKNMAYYRRERQITGHSVIQGVLLSKTPYLNENQVLDTTIWAYRDSITKAAVKGSKEEYFMEIYREYAPDRMALKISNLYSIEHRGLWRMNGEFMGGPFVHYTVVDEEAGELIHVDVFVYAPKFDKASYVRELEGIAHTLQLIKE